METNRYRQTHLQRSNPHRRQGRPIGDVVAPRVAAARPTMPPQPVHAQIPQHQAPIAEVVQAQPTAPASPAVPRPVAQQQPAAAPPTAQQEAHHQQPNTNTHYQPKAADSSTISIKLSIPELRKPTIPPIMKQYPGFWWILALLALFIFTVGYQIGHSHAKPAPLPAAFAPTQERRNS